jgi:quercetin dioxygenase-like cupin family protein
MRRVVTGHDASGKSVFVSDAEPPRGVALRGVPRFRIDEIWSAVGVPALPAPSGEPTTRPHPFFPAPGGTGFLVVTFAPESDVTRAAESGVDVAAAQREFYEAFPGLAATMEPNAPGMHTSQTIDYGVVIRGEVWLELDDGAKCLLKPGDCVIQNGTRHAWHNTSNQECVMAFVVVGANKR